MPVIHEIVKRNSWLLDPRWDSLGHEVDIARLGIQYEGERDPGTGRFIDFLFGLAPKPPAELDQVIVIEIKRGTRPDGRSRRATLDEVNKFHFYVQSALRYYENNTQPPRVRGLMIANGYTEDARGVRATLEEAGSPAMEFKAWDTVLEETRRLHLSWLEVTQDRQENAAALLAESES